MWMYYYHFLRAGRFEQAVLGAWWVCRGRVMKTFWMTVAVFGSCISGYDFHVWIECFILEVWLTCWTDRQVHAFEGRMPSTGNCNNTHQVTPNINPIPDSTQCMSQKPH